MKAQELRIGNWVFDKAHCRKQLREVYADCSVYDPIPLKEEWLLRLGFEKEDYTESWYGKTYNTPLQRVQQMFSVNLNSFAGAIGDINSDGEFGYVGCEIRFVHQVQNLYFALTGEELTIK